MLDNPLKYRSSKVPGPHRIPVAKSDGKLDPAWIDGGVPGTPVNFDDLNDVTITNPQNNDIPAFNSALGIWENKPIPLPNNVPKGDYIVANDLAINVGQYLLIATIPQHTSMKGNIKIISDYYEPTVNINIGNCWDYTDIDFTIAQYQGNPNPQFDKLIITKNATSKLVRVYLRLAEKHDPADTITVNSSAIVTGSAELNAYVSDNMIAPLEYDVDIDNTRFRYSNIGALDSLKYRDYNKYKTNDFCSYGGSLYKSLVDDNKGNTPDSSPTQWSIYSEGNGGNSVQYDIVVTNYAELKSACEDGSYRTILCRNGTYTWTDNIETAITVHENVELIIGESITGVIFDVNMSNLGDMITAIQLHAFCELSTFSLTGVIQITDLSAQYHGVIQGAFAGDENPAFAPIYSVVRRMYVPAITNAVTNLNTYNSIIANASVRDSLLFTDYAIGGLVYCKRVHNVTIRKPQRGFSACYGISGCSAGSDPNNSNEQRFGYPYLSCNDVASCEAIYANTGFYGCDGVSSCYVYACVYCYRGGSDFVACRTNGGDYGFEGCIGVDEDSCVTSATTHYRSCSFRRESRSDTDNTAIGEFNFNDIASGKHRVYTLPDKDGKVCIKRTEISDGDIANLKAFTVDPNNSDLLDHDLFILDIDADSKKLIYFDGTDRFSVELTKE